MMAGTARFRLAEATDSGSLKPCPLIRHTILSLESTLFSCRARITPATDAAPILRV